MVLRHFGRPSSGWKGGARKAGQQPDGTAYSPSPAACLISLTTYAAVAG